MSDIIEGEILDESAAVEIRDRVSVELQAVPSGLLTLRQPEIDALPDAALFDSFAMVKGMGEAAKTAQDRFRKRILERVGEDGEQTKKTKTLKEDGVSASVTYSQGKDRIDFGAIFAEATANGADEETLGDVVHTLAADKVTEVAQILEENGIDPSQWIERTVVPNDKKILAAVELGIVKKELVDEHTTTPDPVPRLSKVVPSTEVQAKLNAVAEAVADDD